MQAVIDAVATITIDSRGTISVSPDPIRTAPSKHVVFVIQNNHAADHTVGVSAFGFKPKDPDKDPKHPMELVGIHSDHVDAGDVGVVTLRVRGQGHFGGPPTGKKFSYKYTVTASDLDDLDPQIEINN
jgi:hypothetical protein